MEHLPLEAPRPRLCHVRKKIPEQEYGFNLHAEKGKGQFIGSVDPGSPADEAGLKPSDRIFAVNGAVITHEDHKKVVSRIKEDPLQCILLVIEEEGECWYRERQISITPELPNILSCPSESDQTDPTVPPPDYIVEDEVPPLDSSPALHIDQPGEPPKPRLCKVHKRTLQDEYGFNLHAEKGKGHFIGKVDQGSLADKAGLEEGQRIVGVNGTLIYPHTPHKDVVFLIKDQPLSSHLLVASPPVDEWYRSRNAPFSFDDAEEVDNTPTVNYHPMEPIIEPSLGAERSVNGATQFEQEPEDNKNERTSPATSTTSSRNSKGQDVTVISVTDTPQPVPAEVSCNGYNRGGLDHRPYESVDKSHTSPSVSHDGERERKESHSSTTSSHSGALERDVHVNGAIDGKPLEPASTITPAGDQLQSVFCMSAAEMREQLSRKKKANPKNDRLSMQQKYEIVRNL